MEFFLPKRCVPYIITRDRSDPRLCPGFYEHIDCGNVIPILMQPSLYVSLHLKRYLLVKRAAILDSSPALISWTWLQ